jgi:Fur family ferric uptake transcriptional regulator
MEATDLLKKHNLRKTATRTEVLKEYLSAGKALSHAELESKLGTHFDRVTLYRTLNSFEEKGLLHKVYDETGTVRFSLCSDHCDVSSHEDDHVHFHCTKCGNSYCLDLPIPEMNLPNDLMINDVYMVANGICKTCQRA